LNPEHDSHSCVVLDQFLEPYLLWQPVPLTEQHPTAMVYAVTAWKAKI